MPYLASTLHVIERESQEYTQRDSEFLIYQPPIFTDLGTASVAFTSGWDEAGIAASKSLTEASISLQTSMTATRLGLPIDLNASPTFDFVSGGYSEGLTQDERAVAEASFDLKARMSPAYLEIDRAPVDLAQEFKPVRLRSFSMQDPVLDSDGKPT